MSSICSVFLGVSVSVLSCSFFTSVRLKYGEGILDFIYTDFKTPMDVLIGKETPDIRILRALFEEPDEDVKVHNFEEKYLLTHEKYVDTISKIVSTYFSCVRRYFLHMKSM